MNMEEVKKLMIEVGWGSFSTTDGKRADVRPMGGWAWFGSELWCATGASTAKVDQISKVPHGAYCFGTQEGKHVRIEGPCTISDDNEDKQKLFDANPILKNFIPDPTAPEYVVIRMKPERIRLMNSTDMTYTEIAPE